ncbi:hypothetical protein Lser_V15G12780 [Lactuca serriola]
MARWCRTLLCCVLIMLFVNNDVLQMTEARKIAGSFHCTSKCLEGKLVNDENGQVPTSGVNTAGGDVDAFRPTNPGHSPGVGHSVHV